MLVEDRWIVRHGLRFHYRDWDGAGTPMILLHGLASQSHIFDLVAPRLAKNFRVLALDQRGHGRSDKPDSGYDWATLAIDLDAILKALRIDRAVLAGHSWGGNVAVQYAADQPDHVSGLILIDGGFLQIGDRLDWPTVEKLSSRYWIHWWW